MGDNIHLGDRDGVRTPMQWSPDRNGGFSRADPARAGAAAIMDPLYGYEAVNVEAQPRDPHSLLQLDAAHAGDPPAAMPRFGRGTLRFLYPKNRKVLAYLREHEGDDDPVRRQPLAHAAGGRARPLRIRRPGAGRADRRLAVPADRPAHLSADACRPTASTGSMLAAQSDAARLAHAGARADARLHHPGAARQLAGYELAGQRRARRSSTTSCRPTSRSAAGSPPRTRASKSARIVYGVRRLPGGDREAAAWPRSRPNWPSATNAMAAAARRSIWEDEPTAAAADAAWRSRACAAAAQVGLLTDAFALRSFAVAVIDAAAPSRRCPSRRDRPGGPQIRVRCRCAGPRRSRLPMTTRRCAGSSAEQSNSSLIVDDAVDAQDVPPGRRRGCIPKPR